jgi:hypothetical protein
MIKGISLKMRIIIMTMILVILASCGGNEDRQKQETPIQKLPFEVDAPWGSSSETRKHGKVTEFSISNKDDYSVQVIAAPAESGDVTIVKNNQLEMVTESPYFRRILLNEPNGFIFEMVVDSSRHYDFRLIKLKDSTQYIFQTDLNRLFSEGETRLMYGSVK